MKLPRCLAGTAVLGVGLICSSPSNAQTHPRDFGPPRTVIVASPVVVMSQPAVWVQPNVHVVNMPVAQTTTVARVMMPVQSIPATPVVPVMVVPHTVQYAAVPVTTAVVPVWTSSNSRFFTGNTLFGTRTLYADGQPVRNAVRFMVP